MINTSDFIREEIAFQIDAIAYKGQERENFSSKITIFMGFNNCYILLQKSCQTLENTKLFTGVLSITSCIVLYRSTLVYKPS